MSNRPRCSFCNSYRHNILYCNDPRTYEIERTLYRNGINLLLTGNKPDFVRYFINNVPLKWLKLFACRLHIRSSDNRNNIIENIYTNLRNSAAYRTGVLNRVINHDRQLVYNSSLMRFEFVTIQRPPVQRLLDELNNNRPSSSNQVISQEFKPTQSILYKEIECHNENQVECPICYTDIKYTEYVKTACNHEYCAECINSMYKTAVCSYKNNMSCAICRGNVTEVKTYAEIPGLFEL